MLVTSRSEFQRAFDDLWRYRSTGFRVDIETNGLKMWRREDPARMCGIAIGPIADSSKAYYFSFRHGEGENLPLELLQPLRELLADVLWLGHNLSFDCKVLWLDGFALPPRILDSMIAAHTANENEKLSKQGKPFALKKLGAQYLGTDSIAEALELKAELKRRGYSTKSEGMENLWRLPATVVGPYALGDIRLSFDLLQNRLEVLRKWRTETAFLELCEFQLVIMRMEIRGIQLDTEEVARQMRTIKPRQAQLLAEIKEMGGEDLNPNSPKQLIEWLGLPKTDKDFLQAVLEREPRRDIHALLAYREVKKATSTYFDPFMELSDSNYRLHTNFKVTGTKTGRLSSNGPNMQNCSRDSSTRSYSLKRCFKAAEGKFLFDADYSAIEPRLAAYFSRDPGLIELFQKGLDVYRPTAARMFKVAEASDEQRTSAKSVILGTNYGIGGWKIAVKLALKHSKLADGSYEYHYEPVWHMSPEGELREIACSEMDPVYCTCEGRSYIRAYFDAVPDLQPCIKSVIQTAKRNDYIRLPLSGRTKRVDHYYNKDRGRMEDTAHKFFNYALQGSAADIMRRALVALDKHIPADRAALLLTVHDSATFEVAEGPGAKEVCDEILRIMETTTSIDPVPLVADAKFGPNWGNMAKYQRTPF